MIHADLEKTLRSHLDTLVPIACRFGDYNPIASTDGYGLVSLIRANELRGVTFVFSTGEVWSINTDRLFSYRDKELEQDVQYFELTVTEVIKSFTGFMTILSDFLKLSGPYNWELGVTGLKGDQ